MGTSSTSSADLRSRMDYRRSSGTTYEHTARMASAAPKDRKVHETLDPKRINSLGEQIRECLDSDAHPATIPVVCIFDETGSMGKGPIILQEKLATLKGITLRSGLPDAQLCFGAYGDADNGEVAPCQIGQFESGLEMEEWLNNLYLEGNGGGNGHETAGLALWFLANYTRLDSVDKRGKKGYIFLTGDEISGPVTRQQIRTYIGDSKLPEADLTMEQVIAQVSEKFEVFFMLVDNTSARYQKSHEFWSNLLGADHVIIVEDLNNIAELIGSVLAFEEGVVDDMNDINTILSAEGSTSTDIAVVSSTLASYTTTSRPAKIVGNVEGAIVPTNTATEML